MKTIEAKDLKVDNIIIEGGYIFKVIAIERITAKAITLRTERLRPNPYCPKRGFWRRHSLNTKIIIK